MKIMENYKLSNVKLDISPKNIQILKSPYYNEFLHKVIKKKNEFDLNIP